MKYSGYDLATNAAVQQYLGNCVFLPRLASILGLFVFGAGGPFLPAGFSQGAEMELLEAFFTFWSAIIIALLTLLGIDVMQIWMLDRQSSKT